jgi:CDP-glucose 4,6-dehydratase
MELFKEPSKFNGNWNFGPPIENNVTVGELITEGLKIWGNSNHKIELVPNPDFHESNLLFLNCDKAHNILKWKPAINFSQTLDFTFGWYKQWTEGADVWQLTQQQIEKYETTF